MRKPQRRIALVTRVTDLQGRTLHFTTPAIGRQRAACEFIDPGRVPAFEGDQAWFELERASGAKPWPFWFAVRQVEPPGSGNSGSGG